MGLLSWLFGKKEKEAPESVEPIEYKSYLIYPESLLESGQYRIAGRITKEINGELQSHRFIRSDVIMGKADANELMLKKSQMLIDQMGDSIFD